MNPHKPLPSRMRLHDQVTRYLGLRILRGEIADLETDLNTETHLSRHLNVSRNILRQAIKVLAAKGLVEVRTRVGLRIRPRSDWHLLDPDLLAWQCEVGPDGLFVRSLSEVRLAIEPLAAQLAAERASAKEIASIRHWYEEMEKHLGSRDRFVSADVQFHAAIFAASQNDLLEQMNTTIGGAFRASQDIVKNLRRGSALALPSHRAIIQAIRRHDGRAARRAAERLVQQAAADLRRAMHSRHSKINHALQ